MSQYSLELQSEWAEQPPPPVLPSQLDGQVPSIASAYSAHAEHAKQALAVSQ